jgi:DNA invertase Pin-like site-specific DNA recombinase
MAYIVYQRCSSDEQAESRHGLNAQADQCAEFVSRNNGQILGAFSDEAISGAIGLEKRPGLTNAVAFLKKGDILLVSKRDRLGRDPIVVALIEAAVARKGARVLSASGEGTIDDEPSSILCRRLADIFSEHERLIIKSRTKLALQAKKVRNERVGHIPFGFHLASDGKHLESDQGEQKILFIILDLRCNGVTLKSIAGYLNAQNLINRGKPWNAVSVLRVSRGKKPT